MVSPVSDEMTTSGKKTHFGFKSVDASVKQDKVNQVFTQVAQKYDIMNDVMSFGVHHFWKWFSLYTSFLKPNTKILDLAAGSGDLSFSMAQKYYPKINLTLADINPEMLKQAQKRFLDAGFFENIQFAEVNAEHLPFPDKSFDNCFMAFGLRNVTNQQKALEELCRVTKIGGRVCILEFSKPKHDWLKTCYDWYSFNVIPKLGALIANDAASYQYLVESIRMHPDQETLKQMMLAAGFDECKINNLSGGIVAVHTGYRY